MLYWLIMSLFLAFPFFWLRAAKEFSWEKAISELFPKPKGWKKEIIGSISLLAILLVVFVALSALLSLIGINDLENVDVALAEEVQSGVLPFLGLLVVVLFIEEFFFRAFLVPRTGIIISTIIFAIMHIGYGSIAEIIGVLVLGGIIAYWYKKNNSLIQVYFAHLFYDFVVVFLFLFRVSLGV